MQKFVLFIVLLLSIFINVDKVDVSANSGTDPIADLWDYDISLDVYTTMQTYDTVDICTDRFDNHIGYTKLYLGVVRRLDEWDEQVFNVKYNYSCHNLVFCSYMNSPTEQRAVYKIDSSGESYSPYRADFLQVITAISRFKVKDGVDSFYHTSSMSNTLKK